MTCRKESCKYEFCWLCLDNWKLHSGGFFKCNKFESGKPVEANKLNTSRASLEKYLFYFNRYANHNQSLTFEKELHKRLEVASFTLFLQSLVLETLLFKSCSIFSITGVHAKPLCRKYAMLLQMYLFCLRFSKVRIIW